jgi:hypothetical protein
VGCEVQFANEDGTVHAVAQHTFALDPERNEDGLVQAATELLKAVTKKVERVHFARPNDSEDTVLQGIAEALRATPKAPDEPGTQG